MNKLTDFPNIGDELERQLQQIGVYSIDDLKKNGSKEAWLKIKKIDPSACINRLYALEGAIRNIRWKDLPLDVKTELKNFYNYNKGI